MTAFLQRCREVDDLVAAAKAEERQRCVALLRAKADADDDLAAERRSLGLDAEAMAARQRVITYRIAAQDMEAMA